MRTCATVRIARWEKTMITLQGTYTALVTPFAEDESIDWPAFDRLLDMQLQGGVQGLVPCGTTGECPTLTDEESAELVRRCVKAVRAQATGKGNARAQVVAGTGSNSTKHAIHLSREAEKAGADAVMVVVPYYNKPTQEGLFQHFVAVAKSVSCPVVVYNVPGRTSIDLTCDTLLRIAESAPNVVATKEATGNVLRAQEIVRRSGARMTVLSGDDSLTLPMIAVGARGVISVTSNVLPKEVAHATSLALDGQFAEARKAHLRLLPVHDVMFVEANPGPAKAALAHRGILKNVVRGPLSASGAAVRDRVAAVLAELG
jgi:4-hydroxy-tetrahydrodipicolinate synthase